MLCVIGVLVCNCCVLPMVFECDMRVVDGECVVLFTRVNVHLYVECECTCLC